MKKGNNSLNLKFNYNLNNMNIIKSLLVIGSFTFSVSCSDKAEVSNKVEVDNKVEVGNKVEVKEACHCSKVTQGTDDNAKPNGIYSYLAQPYTGICETKDQYDSIIERNEYKNGFLISSYKKSKIGNTYVTIDSMSYDNGKVFNGFKISYGSLFDITFVSSLTDFKNGVDKGGMIRFDYNEFSYNFSMSSRGSSGVTIEKKGFAGYNASDTIGFSVKRKSMFKAFLDEVQEADSRFIYY